MFDRILMRLPLYASLHFRICDIRTVLSVQGLVFSVYSLVDIEEWF